MTSERDKKNKKPTHVWDRLNNVLNTPASELDQNQVKLPFSKRVGLSIKVNRLTTFFKKKF